MRMIRAAAPLKITEANQKELIMIKTAAAAAAALVLAGCSTQSYMVSPEKISPGEVCVLPDSSNRKVAYFAAVDGLKKKGFSVKEVSAGGTSGCRAVFSCQTVSRWDMANFTSDISLEYWEGGLLKASAKYHAANGLNFSKYINTEEKINDLLNKMFPDTIYLHSRYTEQ